MARTPRGGRGNPGGPGSRPVQAADRSGGARGLDAPVAFLTAMGGQDDAVTRFGRLVPSARCSGSAPRTALSSNRSTRAGSFPLDPPATAAHLSFQTAVSQTGRGGTQIAVRKAGRGAGGEGCSSPLSGAGMRSQTTVRRQRTEATTIRRGNERAFPQVQCNIVGLAGLEPAASSSSAIEGSALCGPAFP